MDRACHNLAIWFASALLAVLPTLSGCRSLEPKERKSVEELYYEAVLHAYPETSLELQEAPHPEYSSQWVTPASPDPFASPDVSPLPVPAIPAGTFSLPPNATPVPGSPEPGLLAPPVSDVPQAGVGSPTDLSGTLSGVKQSPLRVLPLRRSNGARKRGSRDVVEVDWQSPRPVSVGPKGITQVAYQSPDSALLSDFFEEMDVRQVIQSLATQVGVSVIMDDQVAGVVSLNIESDTFESALQKVLLPLGYVYQKREDGVYLVGVPDPTSALFPLIAQRSEYRPRNLPPAELVEFLPERLRSFARTVERRNLILIEAPDRELQQINSLLQRADEPVPQVMLEAIICVVSPDSGFRFGLNWGHALQLNNNTLVNLGMQGLAFSGAFSPAGVRDAFSDFAVTSAFVQLLSQEGYISIRAAPRVMARDGERAEISITRQTFFSVQPPNAEFFFRQDIQEVQAGIELVITPVIRGENVEIVIEKAEVSEDIRSAEDDPALNQNPFPLINRRQVTTTVNVKDGRTIVIGGLVQRQTVDRVSRIPYLGAVPWIGGVFKQIEHQEQDAEVVIFISPRVISSGPDCPIPANGPHFAQPSIAPPPSP